MTSDRMERLLVTDPSPFTPSFPLCSLCVRCPFVVCRQKVRVCHCNSCNGRKLRGRTAHSACFPTLPFPSSGFKNCMTGFLSASRSLRNSRSSLSLPTTSGDDVVFWFCDFPSGLDGGVVCFSLIPLGSPKRLEKQRQQLNKC